MRSRQVFKTLSSQNHNKVEKLFALPDDIIETDNAEWNRCAADCSYFINTYTKIFEAERRRWIPFELWDFQEDALAAFQEYKYIAWLKSRQQGATWLALAHGLWETIFHAISELLLFSRAAREASYLLSRERLKGMYTRLPAWMRTNTIIKNDTNHFRISNGSGVRAFPSHAGDSYTGTRVIIDEADLIPDLSFLMQAVEPVIELGGSIALIFRPDKSKPDSLAKNIWRAANRNANEYFAIYTPWHANPKRDQAWYDKQVRNAMENTGSVDVVWENYSATPEEALAPKQLGKRLPLKMLERCYNKQSAILDDDLPDDAPRHPNLRIYAIPRFKETYTSGLDCAEGLVNSDDSATVYLHVLTGMQVATIQGKLSPEVHAALSAKVADWYNGATLMVENINQGYTTIQWLLNNGYRSRTLKGHINKYGWTSSTTGKVIAYDGTAEVLQTGDTTIVDEACLSQLGNIESSTLRAPQGTGEASMDDLADAYAFAIQARIATLKRGGGLRKAKGSAFQKKPSTKRERR